MEDKSLFKELLYLGLGTAVISAGKAKDMVKKLVDKYKVPEKEGQKVIEQLSSKSRELKADLSRLFNQVSGRTRMSREEVEDFFDTLIKKPNHMKDKLNYMARKISVNTSLKVEEAKGALTDFFNETHNLISKAKAEAEAWADEKVETHKDKLIKGEEWMMDLKEKSHQLGEKIKPEIKNIVDRTLDKLHLTRASKLEELEKRLNSLEQKEITE